MNRYSVMSITGYESEYGVGEPITTWYLVDNDDMGRVVLEFETEHEARRSAFLSNADERAWEKHEEWAR